MVFNAAHPFTFLFSNSSNDSLLSLSSLSVPVPLFPSRSSSHLPPTTHPPVHPPPSFNNSRLPTRCDAENSGIPTGEIEFNLEMNIESNEQRADPSEPSTFHLPLCRSY